MTVRYRAAMPEDAEQLVELRAVMIDELTESHSSPDEPWWQLSAAWFREHLGGGQVVAFVADDAGRLLAGAVGIVELRPPRPANPSGRAGHVSSVATRRDARRQGHARAVVGMLLDWFDANDVPSQDLTSSAAAEQLYLSLGFHDHPERYLRRSTPRD